MLVENIHNGKVLWQTVEPEPAILLKRYPNGLSIIQEAREVFVSEAEVENLIREMRLVNKMEWKK